MSPSLLLISFCVITGAVIFGPEMLRHGLAALRRRPHGPALQAARTRLWLDYAQRVQADPECVAGRDFFLNAANHALDVKDAATRDQLPLSMTEILAAIHEGLLASGAFSRAEGERLYRRLVGAYHIQLAVRFGARVNPPSRAS